MRIARRRSSILDGLTGTAYDESVFNPRLVSKGKLMILVTTPTGNTGSIVLRQLVEGGQKVRAFARDAQKIPDDLRSKIEIATGSLQNVDDFAKALTGCDTVYYCIPQGVNPPDVMKYYEDYANVAVQAIRKAGTKRVVYLGGAGKASPLQGKAGMLTGLHRAEDILNTSGASVLTMHCPNFYESLFWQVQTIAQMGMMFVAVPGDCKYPEVAIRDVAGAAVKWLTDTSWSGIKSVGVIGPEDMSNNEVAALLSEALGKPVHFQQISREDNLKNLLQFGLSEALANGVSDMYESIAKGLYSVEPRTPETTAPTSYRDWIAEVFLPAYGYMTSQNAGQ